MQVKGLAEGEVLKNSRLFSDLQPAEMARVLESAQRVRMEADEFLFFQEDPAKKIFVLLEGRLKLAQLTPDGQQVILRYITPGEVFGVVAVLSEMKYPVSAQAVDASKLLAWDQKSMKLLMAAYPALSLNAISIMGSRVKEFQDRIRELSTERVERRIARTLLRLARQTGEKTPEGVLINLPLTRQDLAEMSGTTLFTVSRTLSQWETKGLIQAGRERVLIRFPHGLVSIAEDLPATEDNNE
jgi:CRP-like cAMP-binding protein